MLRRRSRPSRRCRFIDSADVWSTVDLAPTRSRSTIPSSRVVRSAARLRLAPCTGRCTEDRRLRDRRVDGQFNRLPGCNPPSLVSLTLPTFVPASRICRRFHHGRMVTLITWHCAAPVDVRAIASLTKLRFGARVRVWHHRRLAVYGMTNLLARLRRQPIPMSPSSFTSRAVDPHTSTTAIDCDAQRASLDALRAHVTVLAIVGETMTRSSREEKIDCARCSSSG